MSRVKLKICGITRVEDARAAAKIADYLGFIFVDQSPRFIRLEKAGKIAAEVTGPEYVGVFANREIDEVHDYAQKSGISFIQLHGDESPEYCDACHLPVIKAFRVKVDENEAQIRQKIEPYKNLVSYILLDAWHPGQLGGTGKIIPPETITGLSGDFPIMLAGGLNPENIAQAIKTVCPAAIDLSSGVEDRPGIKNHGLIEKLGEVFLGIRD